MIKCKITGEVYDLDYVRRQIAELDDDMELVINSPGGSVFEGLQLVNTIQKSQHNITASIECMACSIAAVIALSCRNVKIRKTDLMVLHNCMTFAYGNKEELQQEIEAMTAVDAILHDIITANCKEPASLIARINEGDVWLTGGDVAEMFTNVELIEPSARSVIQNCADLSGLVDRMNGAERKVAALSAELETERQKNAAMAGREARRLAALKILKEGSADV